MCDFVCGTISHAKLSFNRSVLHYQMTLGVILTGLLQTHIRKEFLLYHLILI